MGGFNLVCVPSGLSFHGISRVPVRRYKSQLPLPWCGT